ncbi:serine protease snake [Fopius arisanus]|uniref:Serine protease snake n=1 Tax=Fopius arisanus TaxID=64838 RepID=A0A9R1U707_9HYME|nr:PREDICTED: serine protease snake-like [Fopius arisanus]
MAVPGKLHMCLLLMWSICPDAKTQREGSPCDLETGEPGECKLLKNCPPRIAEVRQGRRQADSPRCGWDKFEEIVCCPTKIQEKIGIRPADLACQQYENDIFQVVTPSITAGIEANSRELPYMAALGYIDKDKLPEKEVIYGCGGTIIAPTYVLTAAHCVENFQNRVPILVRVGAESLDPKAAGAQFIRIKSIIQHPWYRRSQIYNDIALLKLSNPFKWSTTVKPICLHSKSISEADINANVSIFVAGWGDTDFNGERSDKLMRTPSLNLVPLTKCSESYPRSRRIPRGLNDTVICAVDGDQTRRADSCHGDSGGPLLMLDTQSDTIIGITSFGQTCGSTAPAGYTSVFKYLDWIEQNVWPDTQSRSATD